MTGVHEPVTKERKEKKVKKLGIAPRQTRLVCLVVKYQIKTLVYSNGLCLEKTFTLSIAFGPRAGGKNQFWKVGQFPKRKKKKSSNNFFVRVTQFFIPAN